MYYTRESYTNFLDTEINAQIRDFEQVVRTKALVLKSRGNVFVGKFQKLQDNGTAVFKVRNSDNMPRKNSFWTACYLTGEMGSFKNWGDYSWLDLRKDYQRDYSDAYCAWIAKATEEDFCLIGIKKLNSTCKCNRILINNLFKFFVWREVSKSFTRSIIEFIFNPLS